MVREFALAQNEEVENSMSKLIKTMRLVSSELMFTHNSWTLCFFRRRDTVKILGVCFAFALALLVPCFASDGKLVVISQRSIDDIAYCRGGRFLVIAGPSPCLVLTTEKFTIAKKLTGDVTSATTVRTSSDDLTVALVKGKTIEIVNIGTKARITLSSTKAATSAVFSKDGSLLYSGDNSGRVMRWKLNRKKSSPSVLYKHKEGISCLAYNSRHNVLASGSTQEGRKPASGCVCLWDLSAGQLRKRIKSKFGGGVTSVAFNPNGRRLAIGHWKWDISTGQSKDSGIVTVWDMKADKQIISIPIADQVIFKTVFVNDDLLAVAAGYFKPVKALSIDMGGSISIFDMRGKTLWKKTVKDEMVTCVAVQLDKDQMVFGTNCGKIGAVSINAIVNRPRKRQR